MEDVLDTGEAAAAPDSGPASPAQVCATAALDSAQTHATGLLVPRPIHSVHEYSPCVHMQAFVASSGLPASPGQLVASGKSKGKALKIPSQGGLSPSTSSKGKFPSNPLASTGSANALLKVRSQREKPSSIPPVSSSITANVAATISKAKEALAAARARAAAGAGGLAAGHSSRNIEGAVSDKPFTLYGKVEPPPPKPQVQIHLPDSEEAARRK